MSITSSIASRYLIGKKSTNAINLITGVSIFGITVGTAAMILIMSVFNGFESLITEFLNGFNPDLKIVATEGKYFTVDDEQMAELKAIDGIEYVSKSLEEVVLFEYNDQQEAGTIKGVDEYFNDVTSIDSVIRQGQYLLEQDGNPMAISGIGMARKLSLNLFDPFARMQVYSPTRKKKGLMNKDFKSLPIAISGIFIMQTENDHQYILAPYEFVEKLNDQYGKVSSLEIALSSQVSDNQDIIKNINGILGNESLKVMDRYEQDVSYTRIMNIEKWLAFLIVSLTLVLVSFNLIGALQMIVMEKKKDIKILECLGLSKENIKMIYLKLGLFITLLGIVFGFAFALIIYVLQKKIGLISMSDGFVVDAYPISVEIMDFIAVFAMVFLIGGLSSYWTSRKSVVNYT